MSCLERRGKRLILIAKKWIFADMSAHLKMMIRGILILATGAGAALGHDAEAELPFGRGHAHESVIGHIHVGWESHYASEGRDSLDGDSLWTTSAEFSWEHLAGGIWYGSSPDRSYDELQLTLGHSQEIGDLEFYGGYTYFRFPFDGTDDHELGAGLVWSGLPMELAFSADGYYSFEADGYFAEFSLSREFELSDQWTLEAAGVYGVNQGYVSDGHDGANHFALGISTEYALTESCSILAPRVPIAGLRAVSRTFPETNCSSTFFHGGLGLQWSF